MASLEMIAASLQQTSPAMGSCSLSSIKPLHPPLEFGRPSKRSLPPLLASMASKEDPGATLHKESEERSSRSSRPSLLKAVQENYGPNAVMQQVSSLRHFFMPELPLAIITEIKKRVPLSFREDDEEEMQSSHDLSGRLSKEQLTDMGPRCAWPRAKLASAEAEAEAAHGPRCAWPRGSASALDPLQQSKLQKEARSEKVGAKCAWPRAINGNLLQNGSQVYREVSSSMGAQEGNIVPPKSSTEDALRFSEGFDKLKSVSTRLEESSPHVIEGPRCAWPRSSTPRRMLATSVGLGIMNYMFIGQGAPALAILLQPPIPTTCEEEGGSFFSPHKSLLP
ncbi:hypothetical protein L7F22_030291 [Adiantum nelumboides]|nr:hypothetical protein [Adiantum nelumboides]